MDAAIIIISPLINSKLMYAKWLLYSTTCSELTVDFVGQHTQLLLNPHLIICYIYSEFQRSRFALTMNGMLDRSDAQSRLP